MTAFVSVRAETLPNCTGVAETSYFCMGVVAMPSVCAGVAETPPDHNRVARTPQLSQKKRSSLMTLLRKEALEVKGSNV